MQLSESAFPPCTHYRRLDTMFFSPLFLITDTSTQNQKNHIRTVDNRDSAGHHNRGDNRLGLLAVLEQSPTALGAAWPGIPIGIL